MTYETTPALHPDLFGQLAATDPFQGRARRLFERGQVLAVNGNQADLRVGYDVRNNPMDLKEVPIVSGYVPRVGDWVAIQYEAGHSGAPWVTGPTMAADDTHDSPGIGVFSVSSVEPSGPQKSTVYFDESRAVWRGWDGTDWVDLTAKLHNAMPDLQGGTASQYYHFSAAEHGALQDFYDGSAMASGYLKKLTFKAIDASGTSRGRMFERDGDFYWAINAEYDAALDQWNRIDTAEYAYLIAVYSENNIPTEPIGGVSWWRCTPGSNPIGAWTAVGGWELGYMMTEHRNFVMGGMNLEMDGAGAPPYGRLTQIGSGDASGTVVTAMQRNSWYEGSGSWGRDSADKNSAIIGFDANGDLFVWWYPDSSEGNAPWATAAWQERAKFNLGGTTRGRFDVTRSSAETAIPSSALLAKHKTSGNMADGFGSGYAYQIEDDAGVANSIAAAYAVRDGADNTGKLSWQVASAGSLAERMSLTAAGLLAITGAFQPAGGMAHTYLSYSGLTAGHVLTATGANAASFQAPTGVSDHGALTGLSDDDHTQYALAGASRAGTISVEAASAINQDVTTDASVTFLTGNFTGWSTAGDGLHAGYIGGKATLVGYKYVTGGYLGAQYDASTHTWLISGTAKMVLDASGNLQVDGGNIGISADTDLIGLAANALTVRGSLTLSGQNIITDTATGLKIGTAINQKIGFFNATPVVQAAHLGMPLASVGELQLWAEQINQRLENLGINATS